MVLGASSRDDFDKSFGKVPALGQATSICRCFASKQPGVLWSKSFARCQRSTSFDWLARQCATGAEVSYNMPFDQPCGMSTADAAVFKGGEGMVD